MKEIKLVKKQLLEDVKTPISELANRMQGICMIMGVYGTKKNLRQMTEVVLILERIDKL